VERNAAPRGKNLANWGTQIVRELDAFTYVANHGFALHGYRTRKIAIRRNCAQFDPDLPGQIAQSFPIIGGKIHRRSQAFSRRHLVSRQ
jgi:hypothetical protein